MGSHLKYTVQGLNIFTMKTETTWKCWSVALHQDPSLQEETREPPCLCFLGLE